ncbi:F-box/LRR-repeat protein 15-like [Patiria miniata]|uniref:F-box/LRR-repeat protein 15-like leucin rich repeat domain-containing protein n=1 Tax=Patiria miniata TaxID=46514 RepID=A0A914AD09_PATMI|nr:F-box/LRR-repeat protein 15-like [Patiria miniata]
MSGEVTDEATSTVETIDADMSCSINLIDLPWEDVLISRILPHLSIIDIFRLRSMSKDFCDLIQTYFQHQKVLDWSSVASRASVDAFKIATSDAENLQKLVVTSCKSWMTDATLVPLIQRNPRLRNIDLSKCPNLSINMIAGMCPELRTVLLRECCWVSSSMIECLTMKCKNLERIDLTGCWELTDDTIYMLASLQPKLRWLSLARIYGITQVSVEQLAMNCYQLEYLDLEGCWRVTDAAIHTLAQKCPSLKTLKVRDCRNITERSLTRLRCQGVTIDILGDNFMPLRRVPFNMPPDPHMVMMRQYQSPVNYRL